MTEADYEQASQQASQACRQEANEDVEMRDILWPLEKVSSPFSVIRYTCTDYHQAIYGKISTTTIADSSQLESVKVPTADLSGFSYPVGQLLKSGEIKAIPNGKTRWSDGPEDGGGVFRPSEPAVPETTIAEKLRAVRSRKPVSPAFFHFEDQADMV